MLYEILVKLQKQRCVTQDIHDPLRSKYDLNYYKNLAKELEASGAHILGIKDMSGLTKTKCSI